MDHLPIVWDSLTVWSPFLIDGRMEYDQKGFSGYLARRGCEQSFIEEEHFVNYVIKKLPNAALILQDWLYFGMIHEILGDVLQDFIVDRADGRMITTRHLRKHLAAWHKRVRLMTSQEALQDVSKVESCLSEVDRFLKNHYRPEQQRSWPLSADISLAILTLLETFGDARKIIHGPYDPSSHFKHHLNRMVVLRLEQSMMMAGWCPNQISMCHSTFGLSTLYYSSLLKRPFQRNHQHCEKTVCVAYKVEISRYVTKHTSRGCTCHSIAIPRLHLRKIVEKGGTPIVRLDTSPELCLQIVEKEVGMAFIALSHVWSHGLGNAVSNSLPVCQLRRLLSMVRTLSEPPHYFWIDTLCVPRKPKPLRRVGISHINRIYKDATNVLVLDEELVASRWRNRSTEETLMRINLSGWMRRLWTLHESVRSRRIYYQFSDGAVSESELVQQACDTMRCSVSETAMFSRVVQKQAMSLLDHISTLRDEENGYVRIARLWTLLRWRVLSWPEDETICMANMLNVDDGIIDILLSTSSHQRMRSFLSLFREIPMSIIFLPGPRLLEPGWRWAPVSWITPYNKQIEHEGLLLPAQRRAIRTSKGLVMSCQSFMLQPTPNFPILDRKPLYLLEQKTRVRYLLEPDSSRQRFVDLAS
ncbi:hypothetical protein V498_06060 [Pseudogymnoascus sp. VKM F-4517 (FW-2822)]|nr:hypothetical protein V498_06060 [Pseudogymnoascus sp. VKM F-4517 (FW-2822)]